MYVAGWSQGDRNSYLSATDFYYGTSCFSHYKRAFWWRLKIKTHSWRRARGGGWVSILGRKSSIFVFMIRNRLSISAVEGGVSRIEFTPISKRQKILLEVAIVPN